MLPLTSLGAAGTVTGSKHLLAYEGRRVLIDCGLFQGLKALRELNWETLPVQPHAIDAVILTHAHLDHCGYLPRLVRDGFRGKVYATEATRAVAELILMDSAFLQEKDAEFLNRHRLSKHIPALPLYSVHDARRALEHFSTVPFGRTISLPDGPVLRFRHVRLLDPDQQCRPPGLGTNRPPTIALDQAPGADQWRSRFEIASGADKNIVRQGGYRFARRTWDKL